jgi:hypothetical protein
MKTSKIFKIAFGFLASIVFVAIIALNFNASSEGKLNISSNQAFADEGTGKVPSRSNCPSQYSMKISTTQAYNTGDSKVNSFMNSLNGYANGTVSGSYITGTYGANAGIGGGVVNNSLNRSGVGVTKTWTASATLYVANTTCSTGSGTCVGTACADEQSALYGRFFGTPN